MDLSLKYQLIEELDYGTRITSMKASSVLRLEYIIRRLRSNPENRSKKYKIVTIKRAEELKEAQKVLSRPKPQPKPAVYKQPKLKRYP